MITNARQSSPVKTILISELKLHCHLDEKIGQPIFFLVNYNNLMTETGVEIFMFLTFVNYIAYDIIASHIVK